MPISVATKGTVGDLPLMPAGHCPVALRVLNSLPVGHKEHADAQDTLVSEGKKISLVK